MLLKLYFGAGEACNAVDAASMMMKGIKGAWRRASPWPTKSRRSVPKRMMLTGSRDVSLRKWRRLANAVMSKV